MAGGMKLQSAATTGNGNVVDLRGLAGKYAFIVKPSGTITGGAVQFEEAPEDDYAGTWEPIGSSVSVTTDTLDVQQITGRYRAIRARITSNITGGGSVSCYVEPPLTGED